MAIDNIEKISITKYGKIVIEDGRIHVTGYEIENASCREAAILAVSHAIGVMYKEMHAALEEPGSGNIVID